MVPINRPPGSSDTSPVDQLANPSVVLIAVIIAATVIGVLFCFASLVRNEVYVHNLRVETATLKAKYITELRKLQGLDVPGEVDIIEDDAEAAPVAGEIGPDDEQAKAA